MSWDDEEDLDILHTPSREVGANQSAPELGYGVSPASFDLGLGDDDNQDADVLGVDDEVVVKQRRVLIKLDEDKLMATRGIPYLQTKVGSKLMPRLKKQKGSGLRDLSKILQFYQLWAHGLYPRANFQDFIQMARATGKKPRIRMYRQQWISDEKSKSLDVVAQHEDDGAEVNQPDATMQDIPRNASEALRSRQSDLFVGGDDGYDDDDDEDLTMAVDLEIEQALAAQESDTPVLPPVSTVKPVSSSASRNPFVMDDDADLYQMPANFVSRTTNNRRDLLNNDQLDELMESSRRPSKPVNDIPDDDELNELLEASSKPIPLQSRLSNPSHDIPDDDELDELLQLESHPPPKVASTKDKVPDNFDDFDDLNDSDLDDLLNEKSKAPEPKEAATKASEEVDDFEQDAFDSIHDLGF